MKDSEEKVYSYHTFMLPFVFSGDFSTKKNWRYEAFNINEQRDYNEFVYFYKHVQDALYNKSKVENKNCISNYYEYFEQNGTYTIDCNKSRYTLELDGISLRVFNTNIAILSFNLKNTDKNSSSPKDILAINDYGRRIYPQFLGKEFTKDTKKAFLANSITLSIQGQESLEEDFTFHDKIKNLEDIEAFPKLPKFISELIKDNFENADKIKPIIDDRMFVISQYNNDGLSNSLNSYDNKSETYKYEEDEFWYKYLFIDGDSKTCQSKHMTKKLIAESTYDRWVEWGTLFGISRYSFVALTGSWYGKELLLPHMQTMYFQIFTLLLAYRASIIKFSDDIQDVTGKEKKELVEKTRELYKNYLEFLNKLYFKEVTAQDQGIEIYNQAMKVMDIQKYINDLDSEINELHSYIELVEEHDRNKSLDFISNIGAILLPPSLMTGIFGMNILTFSGTLWNEMLGLLLIIFSGFVGYAFIPSTTEKKEKSFISRLSNVLKKYKIGFLCIFISSIITFSLFSDHKDPLETKVINTPKVVIETNSTKENYE